MITEIDLIEQYNNQTGGKTVKNRTERINDLGYCLWIEEKLLEKMNEERELDNLFFKDEK